MDVLNNDKQNGQVVLILNKKEAQHLIDMAEAAADQNKRKRSWNTISKQLNKEACCY